MINRDQLIEIGKIQKLHGLNGEMTASITDPVFDDVKKCPYLVCEVDGIFVPFFIKSYRFRSDASILLTFDDIDTQEAASEFCGRELYFDRRCFTKKEAEAYDAEAEEEDSFIGYTIVDTTIGTLGEVIDIDDQTANVLFIVQYGDTELMVPAADDLVVEIDDDSKTITMNLPQGLINLDEAETE